ncbi:MAG: quinolinate synthase NadA [Lentimicrobium sp.]|jgi:quinolinate synthase|nr:quinolinate synthase NadA [Lentimicrobium sp.]MDD2528734.1 quinolinate synthase NadA [Lentimicrobiaceae bacterium]MDD4599162.1 quinolinate synthase NadA [Lentimicrobiaceae bacterium]MDY0025340.1 quinolinate synthase NadA [Lentimicrobium sp.]
MENTLLQKEIPSRVELPALIRQFLKEKQAILLAHYYQVPEIQDLADFVGDSLQLAQKAAETEASMIVFAGVHFMAETAKILNPDKKVLLPDLNAGCSLADSCPPDDFKRFIDAHPEHKVVSYINCSAAIKTMSDVICTSSNAKLIVDSFPEDQPLIFAPDKNLGAYINSVTGRSMVLWDGSCHVHNQLTDEKVIQLTLEHPEAKLIAHPECRGPILALADFVGSTAALLKFSQTDDSKKYIVATEGGIIHQMQKASPGKEFIVVPSDETCSCNDCPFMKMNTLEKLYLCLKNEEPEILLDENIRQQAAKPIERMLEISKAGNLIR